MDFDEVRDRKQSFLRKEILEKEFDGEEFQKYLAQFKEGGEEIDNWEFLELKAVTKNWLKQHGQQCKKAQQTESSVATDLGDAEHPASDSATTEHERHDGDAADDDAHDHEHHDEQHEQRHRKNSEQDQADDHHGATGIDDEERKDSHSGPSVRDAQRERVYVDRKSAEKSSGYSYKQQMACEQLEVSPIGQRADADVTIIDFQIVKGTLFTSSYVNYVVQTWPMKWEVKRRYSDFLWLRSVLLKQYPGVILPPIPEKSAMNSTSPVTVAKRRIFFENFLNCLMLQPEVKNSPYFHDFLSMKDEQQFKARIKETEKLPRLRGLDQIKNLRGELDLIISDDNTIAADALEDYIDNATPLMAQLKDISRQIRVDYEQISARYLQMATVFKQLDALAVTYNESIKHEQRVYELQESFKELASMSEMLGNATHDQIKHLENHFHNFFVFQEENLQSVYSFINQRNVFDDAFSRIKDDYADEEKQRRSSLKVKKYYVDQPSKQYDTLRKQYAFYSEMLNKEGNRFMKSLALSFARQFHTFANLNRSVTFEMQFMWEQLVDNFKQLTVKQSLQMQTSSPQPQAQSKVNEQLEEEAEQIEAEHQSQNVAQDETPEQAQAEGEAGNADGTETFDQNKQIQE